MIEFENAIITKYIINSELKSNQIDFDNGTIGKIEYIAKRTSIVKSLNLNSKIREKIHYGFKGYTNRIWSNRDIDTYNIIQSKINGYLFHGKMVSENVLNGSHNLSVMYSQ